MEQTLNFFWVVNTCISSTQETETGRSQIGSQPELHSETLSHKKELIKMDKVTYACNLPTFGGRQEGSGIQGQSGLDSKERLRQAIVFI